MKKAALIVVCVMQASPVGAKESTCLNLSDIASSQPNRDGTAITFVMRDGKMWRTDLGKPCPDLGMNGFAWVAQGGRVCENEQMIRVLNSGEICRMGSLTRVPSAPNR